MSNLSTIQQRKEEVLKEMNPKLRKLRAEILTEIERLAEANILARYEIGIRVKESTNEKTYGTGAVERLAESFGKQFTADQLLQCRRLAQAFSRSQIEKLANRKTSGGNLVSYTHLAVLAGLPPDKRHEFQKRIFKEDLTTDELMAAVQADLGRRKNKKSEGGALGRPLAVPKTITAGLAQIGKFQAEIHRRRKVWTEAVFEKISTASPEDCTPKLLENLEILETDLQTLSEDADELMKQVDDSKKRLSSVLEKRKKGGKKEDAKPAEGKKKKAAKPVEGKKKKSSSGKKKPAKGASKKSGSKPKAKKGKKASSSAKDRVNKAKKKAKKTSSVPDPA